MLLFILTNVECRVSRIDGTLPGPKSYSSRVFDVRGVMTRSKIHVLPTWPPFFLFLENQNFLKIR